MAGRRNGVLEHLCCYELVSSQVVELFGTHNEGCSVSLLLQFLRLTEKKSR